MLTQLDRIREQAYALLRIVAGFMFCLHGVQKIFGIMSTMHPEVGSQIWVGGLIELLGGFLILVGAWTRPAAFLCSAEMAVAYVQFHWKLQWGEQFFPVVNKGELAVLYCFVFLYIACRGGGRWSVDSR